MNFQRIALPSLLACCLLLGFSDTARAQSVTLSPQVLNFTVPTNTVSQAQQVVVTTSPAGASVIVSPPSAQWITVGQGSFNTPLNLNVSVNTQGLGQGTYSGTITVSFNPTTTIQQTVTVNLTVTGASALSASPATVTFTGQVGATSGTPTNCALENSPSTCQVTISSSATAFTYSVTPSATWILVSASQEP